MSSRRPPEGGEIYIFPDITVDPSDVTEQYGAEPGEFYPASGNGSTAGVNVMGTINDPYDAPEFPVAVTVEGAAKLPISGSSAMGPILGTAVGFGTQVVSRGAQIPVSRFSVSRAGTKHGVRLTGFPRPTDDELATPASHSVAGLRGGTLLEDRQGRLLYVELLNVTATNNYKIRILRYSQAAQRPQGDWEEVSGTSGPTLSSLTSPDVTAVLFGNDVYVIVSSQDAGTFTVYRLDASDNLTSLGVTLTPSPGFKITGGICAIDCGSHVLLTLGIEGASSGLGTVRPREIHVYRTTDMINWYSADPSDPTSSSISGLKQRLDLGDGYPSLMHSVDMHSDGQRGFSVGQRGRIYYTSDGGVTWNQQDSPFTGVLNCVRIIGERDDPDAEEGTSLVAIACGSLGVILRTDDSGDTWKFLAANDYVLANHATETAERFEDTLTRDWAVITGGANLSAVASDGEDVWVGGFEKLVYISGVGATLGDVPAMVEQSPTTISTLQVRDIVMTPGTSGSVLLFGKFGGDESVNYANYRVLKLTDADGSPTPTTTPESTLAGTDRRYFNAAVARSINIDGAVWAVGELGLMGYRTSAGAWVIRSGTDQFGPAHLTSIDAIFDPDDTSNNEFAVGTSTAKVLRSSDNGATWIGQNVGTAGPVITSTPLPWIGPAVALATPGVVVAAYQGILRNDNRLSYHALPEAIRLVNGDILIAACDLTAGQVDLFFSDDDGKSFQTRELETFQPLTFTPQSDPSAIDSTTPGISAFVDDSGEVFVVAGIAAIVNPDGIGQRWVPSRAASEVSLPLEPKLSSVIASDADQAYKVMRPYGGMRIFGVTRSGSRSVTFTYREWVAGTNAYPPVIPGKARWVGVGDMKATFTSQNMPYQDSWTSNVEYRFAAGHVIETGTRQSYWRSRQYGAGVEAPQFIFTWDRNDADIEAALGIGNGWNFSAMALFGTNCHEAVLQVSVPEYFSGTFPTSDTDYIEFRLSAEVYRGYAASDSASVTSENVVRVANAGWVPGQFKPGTRQFYLKDLDNGYVYRITNNTFDTIMLYGGATIPAISQGDELVVFTDRMVCDGTGGLVGSSPEPNLATGESQHPRWVRLILPSTNYAEGYAKIDTMVAGPQVPVSARIPVADGEVRGFDESWRLVLTPLTEEAVGANGVIAIAYTADRPIVQRWAFKYTAQEWYERDARLAQFGRRLRDAFCLVFDSENPSASAELVRRTFRNEGMEHIGGDLYNDVVEVEEVL